ncbi:MAG: hypothetical protein RL198_575 [Actinomycetota bacterium]
MALHTIKIAAASLVLLTLSSCAATVALEPAENSNDPQCAEMTVRLPSEIPGLPNLAKRFTNAQATAAWGDPVAVIFRCGIEPVSVSELPCVTVSDIDWLVDDGAAPSFRFIAFSRNPAAELIVDSAVASGVTALESVAGAVASVPATSRCTSAD